MYEGKEKKTLAEYKYYIECVVFFSCVEEIAVVFARAGPEDDPRLPFVFHRTGADPRLPLLLRSVREKKKMWMYLVYINVS